MPDWMKYVLQCGVTNKLVSLDWSGKKACYVLPRRSLWSYVQKEI